MASRAWLRRWSDVAGSPVPPRGTGGGAPFPAMRDSQGEATTGHEGQRAFELGPRRPRTWDPGGPEGFGVQASLAGRGASPKGMVTAVTNAESPHPHAAASFLESSAGPKAPGRFAPQLPPTTQASATNNLVTKDALPTVRARLAPPTCLSGPPAGVPPDLTPHGAPLASSALPAWPPGAARGSDSSV